jgi:hypothetical protein
MKAYEQTMSLLKTLNLKGVANSLEVMSNFVRKFAIANSSKCPCLYQILFPLQCQDQLLSFDIATFINPVF